MTIFFKNWARFLNSSTIFIFHVFLTFLFKWSYRFSFNFSIQMLPHKFWAWTRSTTQRHLTDLNGTYLCRVVQNENAEQVSTLNSVEDTACTVKLSIYLVCFIYDTVFASCSPKIRWSANLCELLSIYFTYFMLFSYFCVSFRRILWFFTC